MSSHEVVKHSRKILGVVKNKDSGLRHKLGEILIEILVIVFAISFSFLLERWRQKAEDRELEKNFLIGLKTDLTADLKELKESSLKWISMKEAAKYFSRPEQEIVWSSDSTKFYSYGKLFHDIYFFPNISHYESIKSTGKLDVIENKKLQNDIIDLYQTKIPDLMQEITFFNSFMNTEVLNHLIHNLKRDDKNQAIADKAFFTNVEMRNLLALYSDLDDALRRSDSTIVAGEKILKEIDEME